MQYLSKTSTSTSLNCRTFLVPDTSYQFKLQDRPGTRYQVPVWITSFQHSSGSNHHWNLILTSVPYHCFSFSRRGWYFSVLPRIIVGWFMFLRWCIVFLEGFLRWCTWASSKSCNFYACNIVLHEETPVESLWSLGHHYFSVQQYSHSISRTIT